MTSSKGLTVIELGIVAVIVGGIIWLVNELSSVSSSSVSSVGILGGSGVLAASLLFDLPALAVIGGVAALGYGIYNVFATSGDS